MLDIHVRNIIFIVLLLLIMYFCLQMVNESTIQEGAKFNFGKWIKNTAKKAGKGIVKAANVVGKGTVVSAKFIGKKLTPPPPKRKPSLPKFDGISTMLQHMNTIPFFSGVAATSALALASAGIVNLSTVSQANINAKKTEIETAYNEITKYVESWQDYVGYMTDSATKQFFQGSYKIVISNLKIAQDTFKIDTKNRDQLRKFIIILSTYGLSLDQAKTLVATYNLKSINELDTIYSKITLKGMTKPALLTFLDSANKKFQVPLKPDNYDELSHFIKILAYYGITDYTKYTTFSSAFLSSMSINYQDFVTMYDINIHYGVAVPNMSNFIMYIFSMNGACDMKCSEVKGKYNLSSKFLTQYEQTICKLRGFGIQDTDIYLQAMGKIPFNPFSETSSTNKECYINTFKQYGIERVGQIKRNNNRLHNNFPVTSANILEISDYISFGMTSGDNLFDFINKLNEIKVNVITYPRYKFKINSEFNITYPKYNTFHNLLMKIQYYWSTEEDFNVFIKDVNTFNSETSNKGVAKLQFFVDEITKFGLATYIDYRNFMDFMNANVNITNINLKKLIGILNQFGITNSTDTINLVNSLKEPLLKLNLNKSYPFSEFLEKLMALGVNASNIATANIVDLIAGDGTTYNKALGIRPNITPKKPIPVPNTVSITTQIPMNEEGFVGMNFDIYSLLGSLTGSKVVSEGFNNPGVLQRLKAYGAISIDNICSDEYGNNVGWEKFSKKMEEFGIPASDYAINSTIMVLEIFKTDFGVSLHTIYPILNIAIKFGINVDNLKQFSADIRYSLLNSGKMSGNDLAILLDKWVKFDVRYTATEKCGDYRSLLTAGKQFGWNAIYISDKNKYYSVFDVLTPHGITHRRHLNDTRFSIFVHNMTSILKLNIEKLSVIVSMINILKKIDEIPSGTPSLQPASHNMRDLFTPMPKFIYKIDAQGKTCLQSNTCDGSEEAGLVNLMINSTENVFNAGLLVPFLLSEEYNMFKEGNIQELLEYFKTKYSSSESQGLYKFIKHLTDAFYKKLESDKNSGVYANYEHDLKTYNIVRFFPYATFAILAGDIYGSDQYDDVQNTGYLLVNSEIRKDAPIVTAGSVEYQQGFSLMNSHSRPIVYRTDDQYETMLNLSSSLWKAYAPYGK